MLQNSDSSRQDSTVTVDKSELRVRRERRWFTAGESPARELVRSTR